jgi:hypothetical protein
MITRRVKFGADLRQATRTGGAMERELHMHAHTEAYRERTGRSRGKVILM